MDVWPFRLVEERMAALKGQHADIERERERSKTYRLGNNILIGEASKAFRTLVFVALALVVPWCWTGA
jgi:hypothetical protein